MKEETRDFIDKLPTEINCMKEHPKNTSLSPSCNRNNHKDCDSDVCNCPCHLKEKENPVEESLRKTFEEATSEEEKCEHKVIEECVRDICVSMLHNHHCRDCGKPIFIPVSPSDKTWTGDDPVSDINKVKCSCGQYYMLLDHKCYAWVEDFDRQFPTLFSSTIHKIEKEKMKTFIQDLLTSATIKAKIDTLVHLWKNGWANKHIVEYARELGINLEEPNK